VLQDVPEAEGLPETRDVAEAEMVAEEVLQARAELVTVADPPKLSE